MNSRHKAVSALVTHELSHVWFGNLVTARTWSEVWLNEGFANHFEHFEAHAVQPHLGLEEDHRRTDMEAALKRDDGRDRSRPMVRRADGPEEVRGMFDDLAYGKGSAVVAMVRAVMGERAFWGALREYLRAFSYGSAGQENLFAILDKHAARHRVQQSYHSKKNGISIS